MPENAADEAKAVPFGGADISQPLDHWSDGYVVLLGASWSPDNIVVFTNGEAQFYNSDGPYTPRVEDWCDTKVVVVHDFK